MSDLIALWRERLQRFEENPEVTKGMDESVAMGVQTGRIITLAQCIRELEKAVKNGES